MGGISLTQTLISIFVAAFVAWLVHIFSIRRDLANERRKLRVTYLLEAYRNLETASNRELDSKEVKEGYRRKFESAMADIQLLGSVQQVKMAKELSEKMTQNKSTSFSELLFSLRGDLRLELELEPVTEKIIHVRLLPPE